MVKKKISSCANKMQRKRISKQELVTISNAVGANSLEW
jgi:hypothetical protein